MTTYSAKDVTVTIDGVELEGLTWSSWSFKPPTPPIALAPLPSRYEWSFSYSVPMKRRAWKRMVVALTKKRYLHASFETLWRRVKYGGRKGRRALRRLMAMPDSAWRAGL